MVVVQADFWLFSADFFMLSGCECCDSDMNNLNKNLAVDVAPRFKINQSNQKDE